MDMHYARGRAPARELEGAGFARAGDCFEEGRRLYGDRNRGRTLVRPPYGAYQPAGRSALVRRVVRVPVPIRRVLGVNDYVAAAVDSIVTMCAIVLEESEVPLLERLSQTGSEFAVLKEAPDWITDALQHVSDTALTDWLNRLKRPIT